MEIILISLTIIYITYVLSNLKFENTNEPLIKFNKSLIRVMSICSLVCIIMVLIFGASALFSYINKGISDNVTNLLGIFIIIFILFFLESLLYLYLKKKQLIILNKDFTYKSLFQKKLNFNISDIEKVEDYPGSKIVLLLKSQR